jgi:histidine phosphotransfer protein HptB
MEDKPMPTAAAPIIDERVLAQLEEELEDRHVMTEFLRRYLRLLDPRLQRLDHALAVQDPAMLMDALLSLKTSSMMAGAMALAQAATTVHDRYFAPAPTPEAWPGPADRARLMAEVSSVAEATREHLGLFVRRLTV